MDRKEATRLWREVSRGAPEGVPTGRTLHEFAQRVEALARKREGAAERERCAAILRAWGAATWQPNDVRDAADQMLKEVLGPNPSHE